MNNPEQFDFKDLRNAFGNFLTGVTVVTCRDENGEPRGLTANSFTSVSLNPAIILVCVDKTAKSKDVFVQSSGFAVSILSEHQTDISSLFASKRPDKFKVAAWSTTKSGYPIIDGACGWFGCQQYQVVEAGDHIVLFGLVTEYHYNHLVGLGYIRGSYVNPKLEQSALRAMTSESHVIVGVIVEYEGQLLLLEDSQTGNLYLPSSGLDNTTGSFGKLESELKKLGIDMVVSSLFAVFEDENSGQQHIYYRFLVDSVLQQTYFWNIDTIPWDRISSTACVSMLKRYISESYNRRFGIYFGGAKEGQIKILAQ